jgi:hypothetical protein
MRGITRDEKRYYIDFDGALHILADQRRYHLVRHPTLLYTHYMTPGHRLQYFFVDITMT